jgi:hypothetical protein
MWSMPTGRNATEPAGVRVTQTSPKEPFSKRKSATDSDFIQIIIPLVIVLLVCKSTYISYYSVVHHTI